MTDRELLAMAAKAGGIDHRPDVDKRVTGWGVTGMPQLVDWNPLADDGDALRLAAHLRLRILPGKHKGDGCTVEAQERGVAGCTSFRDSTDMAEQMRHAIVHVAAEIGKTLP